MHAAPCRCWPIACRLLIASPDERQGLPDRRKGLPPNGQSRARVDHRADFWRRLPSDDPAGSVRLCGVEACSSQGHRVRRGGESACLCCRTEPGHDQDGHV